MVHYKKILYGNDQIKNGLIELAKQSRICMYPDFFEEFLPDWDFENKKDKIYFYMTLKKMIEPEFKETGVFITSLLVNRGGTPPISFYNIAFRLDDTIDPYWQVYYAPRVYIAWRERERVFKYYGSDKPVNEFIALLHNQEKFAKKASTFIRFQHLLRKKYTAFSISEELEQNWTRIEVRKMIFNQGFQSFLKAILAKFETKNNGVKIDIDKLTTELFSFLKENFIEVELYTPKYSYDCYPQSFRDKKIREWKVCPPEPREVEA